MTKIEERQFNIARRLVAVDMPDAAVRVLSIIHRSARSRATQRAVLDRVAELGLADRVTMYNGCLAHVADVPAVRS